MIYEWKDRGKKHLLGHVLAQEFHSHSSTIKHSKQFILQARKQSLIIEMIKYTVRVSAQAKLLTNKNQPLVTLFRALFIGKISWSFYYIRP